jgi:hypothetical protein
MEEHYQNKQDKRSSVTIAGVQDGLYLLRFGGMERADRAQSPKVMLNL